MRASILLPAVLAGLLPCVPAHAQDSLPAFCTVGGPMLTPPKQFHCPEGYEKLTGETPGEVAMFVLAWHCRSTGYSLGAIPWGGCAGSKGLATFGADGWSLTQLDAETAAAIPKTEAVAAAPTSSAVNVEPTAIIDPDIETLDNRDELLSAMVDMIERRNWRCDSISAVRPTIFSNGFVVRCNAYSYKYVIKDRDGNWTVTLK